MVQSGDARIPNLSVPGTRRLCRTTAVLLPNDTVPSIHSALHCSLELQQMPVRRDPRLRGGWVGHAQTRIPNGRLPELPPLTRRLCRGNRQVDTLVFLEPRQKHHRGLSIARYPPAPIERQRQRRAKIGPHGRGWQIKVGTPLRIGQAIVLHPGLTKVRGIPVPDERRVSTPNVVKCFSLQPVPLQVRLFRYRTNPIPVARHDRPGYSGCSPPRSATDRISRY